MNQEEWKIETPEHVSLRVTLAGLGSRGAALLIDMCGIALMHIGLFAILFFMERNLTEWFVTGGNVFYAIVLIISFLLNWGYFFLMELLAGGRTLGKMFMGVRVVDDQGGSPTGIQILVRNLLRAIDMLPIYYLLGMIMVFSHPKHKRLGDLMAGTIVVHEGRKKKSQSKIDKEIEKRGLSAIPESERSMQMLHKKEWDLLKAYVDRFPTLSSSQRSYVTLEVAHILFPKVGIDTKGKTSSDLEDELLKVYLTVRDDWEFHS